MEKDCTCKSFEKKEILPEDVLNNFNIITRSQPEKSFKTEEGGYTSLLKCLRCKSYYLMNIYNSLYLNQKTLSIRKYNPKIDEIGLVKILKNMKGIISDIEMDEYSGLYAIINKALRSVKKYRKKSNENKN